MRSREDQLFEACQSGNIPLLQELLKEKDIDINITREDNFIIADRVYQETPLILACRAKQFEVVKILLNDSRIDVNKKIRSGAINETLTALRETYYNGDVNTARLLLTDERVDKSEDVEFVFKMLSMAGSEHTKRYYQLEKIKKLIMFFICMPIKEQTKLMLDHMIRQLQGAPDDFPPALSERDSEAYSVFFANVLFLEGKKDTSLESLISTMLQDDAPVDEVFKSNFNTIIYSKIKGYLPSMLAALTEQAKRLDEFKSLPQIKNASTFLQGFFDHPTLKQSKNANDFGLLFQELPPEVRINVAGHLFHLSKKYDSFIDQESIKREEEDAWDGLSLNLT